MAGVKADETPYEISLSEKNLKEILSHFYLDLEMFPELSVVEYLSPTVLSKLAK